MAEHAGYKTVWVDGVHPVTGEIGKVPVFVGRRVKLSEKYMFLFQEMLYKLCCDRRMTGERLRVFGLLLGRCDWENWIQVRQRELATDAGMHVNQVSRSIRFLMSAGVIEQGPQLGRGYAYKLNSHYGYKGKLVNLAQHRRREAQRD